MLDLTPELDLEAIHSVYRQKDLRGKKAYSPPMKRALRLCAEFDGLASSRKIEKACR